MTRRFFVLWMGDFFAAMAKDALYFIEKKSKKTHSFFVEKQRRRSLLFAAACKKNKNKITLV